MKNTHKKPTPPVAPFVQEISEKFGNHTASNIMLNVNPAPYPKITGSNDPDTVTMLKQDYAGSAGELTAITQYIFQNISVQNNDSFANALLKIAISEMSHLHMLGNAIEALGGNLHFNDGRHYWNAANIDYSLSYEAMLLADIKAETIAIANYEKHAALTKNDSVRNLLLRIVEDEKLHLRFFQETLAQIQ